MTEYPRTVVLENAKLKDLLTQKNDLIIQGREKSEEIELVEKEMAAIEAEIVALEQAVDTADIDAEAKAITEVMNATLEQMRQCKAKLSERLKEKISPDVIALHATAKKKKEALEKERNKIGLKVQKLQDKVVPLAQAEMKPHLQDKYEDFDTIRIENGEVVASIFNHMTLFVDAYEKKLKK